MNGFNWFWIAIEATAAPLVGFLVALPLWYKDQAILGNVAGTVVIFGTAFSLILREHVQLDVLVRKCIDDGVPCFRIRKPSRASPSTRSSRCSK